MTSAIGHLTVLAALILAVVGATLCFSGGWRQRPELAVTGEKIALAVFGLMTLTCGIMVYALVTHDFSVEYVAEVGSRQTPLYYTIISLWAALAGSILFWGFILSGYTAALILIHRGRYRNFMPYAVGTLVAINAFFLFVMAGPGNPFVYVPNPPSNGPGPNALLQNHPMMGLHPPLLYLGYVGLSVPFALAIGSLLARDTGPAALSLMRRWSLVSWLFLTLGIIAGMFWSYDVLGWGGYWSWDPVENVVLMPWLITTAFLHSLQVQERRHMLKAWTVSLIVCAFLLSIMGTFLTRSGVVDSVHSFTQSTIGPVFLAFLGVMMVLSLGLIAVRSRELAAPGTLDTLVSRESAFLLNNLLLVALTFTVLIGTLFPLIAEAVSGQTLSVGGPYYDQVAVPIALALLFLMGVGPLLPWGASDLRDTLVRLILPATVAVATLTVLLAAGVRGSGSLLVFTLVAFVAASTASAFTSDITSRRRATHEAWITAGATLVRANPRRYAGYLAHVGLLVVVVGIASSQAFTSSSEATLTAGKSMQLNGYTLTLSHIQSLRQPNRRVVRAVMIVEHGNTSAGTLSPSVNIYPNSTDPIVTPAVSMSPTQDLYLVLRALSGNKRGRAATIQAYTKPLISWIWGGGAIIGLGAIMALMPRRRRAGSTVMGPIAAEGKAFRK